MFSILPISTVLLSDIPTYRNDSACITKPLRNADIFLRAGCEMRRKKNICAFEIILKYMAGKKIKI